MITLNLPGNLGSVKSQIAGHRALVSRLRKTAKSKADKAKLGEAEAALAALETAHPDVKPAGKASKASPDPTTVDQARRKVGAYRAVIVRRKKEGKPFADQEIALRALLANWPEADKPKAKASTRSNLKDEDDAIDRSAVLAKFDANKVKLSAELARILTPRTKKEKIAA